MYLYSQKRSHFDLLLIYRLKEKKPYFLSFDNAFLTEEHPELIKEMNLESHFRGMKFLLNTLFISNFPAKILGMCDLWKV